MSRELGAAGVEANFDVHPVPSSDTDGAVKATQMECPPLTPHRCRRGCGRAVVPRRAGAAVWCTELGGSAAGSHKARDALRDARECAFSGVSGSAG